jgi:Xaa-Pro aminopeptidase
VIVGLTEEEGSVFSAATYRARRAGLQTQLETGMVLFPGHATSPINFPDNPYPFRQDSSFLYYGGCNHPDLALLVDIDRNETFLSGVRASAQSRLWHGAAPDAAEMADAMGAECFGTSEDLVTRLAAAQAAGRAVHYLPPYRADQILRLGTWLDRPPAAIGAQASLPLVQAVVRQRSIKAPEEIAEIETALGICRQLYQLAVGLVSRESTPQEIAARMEGLVLAGGSRFAFAPIVTPQGDVLHAQPGAAPLQSRDLVLLDYGAESSRGYASDITRTMPVGGKFSTRQREIYDLVLKAQKDAIALAAPNRPFRDIHLAAARTLCGGLCDLGLMKGDPAEAVAQGAHALFFPHGLGHMLGLDVHDMEALGEEHVGYDAEYVRSGQFGLSSLRLARRLQPGFVVTVEPGIYFNAALIDAWSQEAQWKSFINFDRLEPYCRLGGIRIEDDVLITEGGSRVLGPTIPKSAGTVEASLEAAHKRL